MVDEKRNIERLDIYMDIPNLGHGVIQEYINLTARTLSVFIPKINYCEKHEIPFNLTLKDYFDKIERGDPSVI